MWKNLLVSRTPVSCSGNLGRPGGQKGKNHLPSFHKSEYWVVRLPTIPNAFFPSKAHFLPQHLHLSTASVTSQSEYFAQTYLPPISVPNRSLSAH